MSNNNKKIYDPIVESSISDQEDFDTLFDQPSSDGGGSGGEDTSGGQESTQKTETPTLDAYGTWLNDQVKRGMLDPVYGREKELQRITQILARKKKNNPLLLGEPGVGKTAVVEALAQRIASGNVPPYLLNKRIVAVDMSSIVAGTMYRGQFEERMKKLIHELKANPDVILYMDEIHTLMGSGNTQGGVDAASMLKPPLARGEIRCIGATTLEEYRKSIEKDGAMDRRFQKVMVNAPDEKETLLILKKLQPIYEKHHHVTYTEKALESAVYLTERYVTDRQFPDKAIDALDEAGAYSFIKNQKPVDLKPYQDQIDEIRKLKLQYVNEGRYDLASQARDKEKQYQEDLKTVKRSLERGDMLGDPTLVDSQEVEYVVSLGSGVPVQSFTAGDLRALSQLESTLKSKVIGQDHVVRDVATAIQRNKVGLRDPGKPIGSFLFLGSSGVGKTYLSKMLAKELFGTEDAMIRVDMSEFMEKYSVSRLIGAPPGYVGYDQGGELTVKVKRRPYSVILFDEIEKAHPDVQNLMLQILDDGVLTDSTGDKVNFKNTIIIMTSNVGTRQLSEFGTGIGFKDQTDGDEAAEQVIRKALNKRFAPEFLNRIDKIVTFNQLKKQDIRTIADLELSKLDKRLEDLNIRVRYSDEARDFVADKGFDPKLGARPLKRAIAQYIEEMITDGIISGEVQPGEDYLIDVDGTDKDMKLKIMVPEPLLIS
ncbi:MAG: ATP-dependent Clp protease ATP-binding subunit [Porphyromonas sp.]|uniref:ATP-dependent Clp protease ATP-binding subunit n=1 Tax=Porphyromonas sp. TaxID=1924944 RepID=UPI002A90F284|nr:ATP-dependent Clp protease ATP-binding subunit [Porphyromonas sp.]MDD7468467.1 ATP-dependent Clp protease ATP-binding subunit [Bacteroidales bacterium]MDY6101837.1 ATP-dependent Clp protease ATP-binding subunit [Porphyromonas sp.]